MTVVPFPPGQVFVRRLQDNLVVLFGETYDLDLFQGKRVPLAGGMRTALQRYAASAGAAQPLVDGLSGRVVYLTKESMKLLDAHQEVTANGALLGVVRGADGKFAGMLTFTRSPLNVAAAATALPALASTVALQLQLARIEKSLDAIKQDVDYLIHDEHLEIEASIVSALGVLRAVYAEVQESGRFDDDQWDRVVNTELEVRKLHAETRSHLRSLESVLDAEEMPLPKRVQTLNTALRRQRTDFWLQAHVHADLALLRWDLLYLVRQAQEHPEDIARYVDDTREGVETRERDLTELGESIATYLQRGQRVDSFLDQLRLVSRKRMGDLLFELDAVCRAYGSNIERLGVAAPILEEIQQQSSWDRLTETMRLPAATAGRTATFAVAAAGTQVRSGLKRFSTVVALRPGAADDDQKMSSSG